MKNNKTVLAFLTILILGSLELFSQTAKEFRAVWVATVDNIDWPSKKNWSSDSQKVEFIKLLDLHQKNGINAIIAQIRPAADAFYPSSFEPWSEWLTGQQGRPPKPYYDPLQFMIEETHRRGMEFHAWCNPYRATFNIAKSSIAPTHVTKIHPDWFLTYGTTKYFDPGNKEAQHFVTNVVRDVVSRYDVDAIHFDDYFYPYKIAGKEFPDAASFKKYGNGLDLDSWRRSNVDSIILSLSNAIKQVKPYCRFGISPFGVWRNKSQDSEGSATEAGQTNYDDLYADILLWLKNGWIDYVAPQIYWEFGHPKAPYEVILDWWGKHSYGKHCYIGLGIYRAGNNEAWKDKTQLPRQIEALRNTPNVQGMIFFSSKSFYNNPNGWNDSLKTRYFVEPALIPPMEWITVAKPEKPKLLLVSSSSYGNASVFLVDGGSNKAPIRKFIVYTYQENGTGPSITDKKIKQILIAENNQAQLVIPQFGKDNTHFAISSIDANNNESEVQLVGQ